MTTADAISSETEECRICSYCSENGWWGPDLAPAKTHCSRCHRSWASTVEGHCSICCAHFANVKAFDAHLLEAGGCTDPASITRKDGRPRLTTRETPYGVTYRLAFYGVKPDFIKAKEEKSKESEDITA